MSAVGGIRTDRRIVFQGLGSLGVAVALAGCGSSGDGDGTATDGGGGGDAPATGAALATTSEVPVGGGVVLGEQEIVVTQPTEGEFKAYTAVCTHQACLVSSVADGTITCDCHGSTFDAGTGEVTGGPAPAALTEVAITVDGDQILTA